MRGFRLLVLAILTLTFLVGFVSADTIPENSHPLARCVKISNLNEYPNLVFIGYYTGPGADWAGSGENPYIINQSMCLTKGYKFNTLHIYLLNKSYFDSVGLNGIKMINAPVLGECPGGCFSKELGDDNAILINTTIEPYGGYIVNSNHLVKEDVEYSIAGFSEGKLILYLSKRTSEYNSGISPKIETFQKPTPEPNPNPVPEPPVKKSFWSSITCFFKELFGSRC